MYNLYSTNFRTRNRNAPFALKVVRHVVVYSRRNCWRDMLMVSKLT